MSAAKKRDGRGVLKSLGDVKITSKVTNAEFNRALAAKLREYDKRPGGSVALSKRGRAKWGFGRGKEDGR